ncbi:MAG: hypothetical protein D6691_03480 [Candidatus Hydrogenedentota bacterium]|nr:class A beta-lactamase-related serine hydrolase [Candidatus Sumerlaea chitinivorans]RMH29112.1 MAG: hypothetical protein D6691_03480 [Candidatus Hydrogenedentota bacterium]GIX43804.1 MAG: hypothetical protein KatS3mg130_0212 [Candidatus Sumerlaea sp.]
MRRSLWFCGVVAMAAGVAFAQETLVPRMPAATCGGYNFWAYDGRARVELDKYCRERIPLSETQRLLCDLVESQILSKKVAEWTDLAGASCAPLNQEDVAVTWLEICRESGGPPHFGHFAGNEPMYASSLAQLFYAVAAYKKLADQGISQSKIESDIEAMLAENDYEAANRVVDFVTGTESGDELTGGDFKAFKRQRNVVNRYFRDLGFENFNVNQKFWTDTPSPRDLQLLGKPLSQNYEHSNRVTANQVAALAYLIDREAIVSPQACQKIKSYCSRHVDQAKIGALAGIAAGLPRGAKMWGVKGFTRQNYNEVAVVDLPNGSRYVLAVLSRYQQRPNNFATQVSRIAAHRAMMKTGDDERTEYVPQTALSGASQ